MCYVLHEDAVGGGNLAGFAVQRAATGAGGAITPTNRMPYWYGIDIGGFRANRMIWGIYRIPSC